MTLFFPVLVSAMLLVTTSIASENFNSLGISGEAIVATQQDMVLSEQYHFSPAYRAGDFVFLSGVVVEPPGNDPATLKTYQAGIRKAFSSIKATLAAAGTDFHHVIKMTTFHVFHSPHFVGNKTAHINAFMAVKDEYLPPPYAAWTAIGVSELFPDRGLVEIQITAYAPTD